MADPAKDATPEGSEVVIEQSDLLKSIQDVEAAAKGVDPKPEPEPETVVAGTAVDPLAKTVTDEGGDELKKSLDVSSTLKEFADLVGVHVDGLTGQFAKALDGQNAFQLAALNTIQVLAKSVTELAAKVEEFGKTADPAGAKSKVVADPKGGDAVLEKGAVKEGEGEAPALTQADVMEGLESLVKSAKSKGDEDGLNRFTNALVKFNSTGQLDDRDLKRAVGEYRRIAAEG